MINQIMFIDFKAINIFWRQCFVTNGWHTLKVCFFHKPPRHEQPSLDKAKRLVLKVIRSSESAQSDWKVYTAQEKSQKILKSCQLPWLLKHVEHMRAQTIVLISSVQQF